jgi:hypothetical protein
MNTGATRRITTGPHQGEDTGISRNDQKPKMEQTIWCLIVERHARRAREYSDAVARLGRANLPAAECHELLEAIKARHKSCMAAAEEVGNRCSREGSIDDCVEIRRRRMNSGKLCIGHNSVSDSETSG